MSEAPRLYQLQIVDLELDEKRRQLTAAEVKRQGVPEALRTAREQLEAAEKERDALEKRSRELERDLERDTAKIADLQKRLFGGGVAKLKEAGAIEKELETLRSQRHRLEDELLEAMAAAEEVPEVMAARRASVADQEAGWQLECAELERAVERLHSEIESAQQTRDRLSASLPPAALGKYEELRRTHKGRAVARIERSTCLGCRVALPMGEVQRVRTSAQLSFCSFCGRILFSER